MGNFKRYSRLPDGASKTMIAKMTRYQANAMTKTILRSLAVRAKSLRIANEDPISHPQHGRVLLFMGGMKLRNGRKAAIPLTINSETVRGIVGSMRNLSVIDRALFGTIQFASDKASQVWAKRWSDGFFGLDNLRLDFEILEGERVPAGRSCRGEVGPFVLGRRWSPTCVVIT